MDQLALDILDQPRAIRETAAGLCRGRALVAAGAACRQARQIVLAGMGGSYFAAYPAYLRLLGAGRAAAWIEAGELLHHGSGALGAGTALVLVSQSGRSAEIARLLEIRGPGPVIAITNDPRSPLAQAATICLPLDAGPEAGVSTKTYTAELAALDLLVEAVLGGTGGEARWEAAAAANAEASATREHWLPGLAASFGLPEHLWLLGRGPGLSAAYGGALALKEATRIHSEGMSAPQYRHGPLEGAGPGRCGLVLCTPGDLGALDLALAAEMAAAGMVVCACTTGPLGTPLPPGVDLVALPATPALTEPAVAIVAVQWLAHTLAVQRGVVPGTFQRIGKVTTRE